MQVISLPQNAANCDAVTHALFIPLQELLLSVVKIQLRWTCDASRKNFITGEAIEKLGNDEYK